METELIAKAVLCTVGVVQMLKNFIPVKIKWMWALITIVVGVVFSLPFIPEWVMTAALVVSGATLFYDTIMKSFEKLFTKFFSRGNDE